MTTLEVVDAVVIQADNSRTLAVAELRVWNTQLHEEITCEISVYFYFMSASKNLAFK